VDLCSYLLRQGEGVLPVQCEVSAAHGLLILTTSAARLWLALQLHKTAPESAPLQTQLNGHALLGTAQGSRDSSTEPQAGKGTAWLSMPPREILGRWLPLVGLERTEASQGRAATGASQAPWQALSLHWLALAATPQAAPAPWLSGPELQLLGILQEAVPSEQAADAGC